MYQIPYLKALKFVPGAGALMAGSGIPLALGRAVIAELKEEEEVEL